MSADTLELRRALGQFATGVTVVTTCDAAGAPVGVTASSFNSVSLDPPLILWSIKKDAWSTPAFLGCRRFAVHVLSAEQIALSNRFAQRGANKFADIDWAEGEGGTPILPNALARFDCESWANYEGGDHIIQVGKVASFTFDDRHRPLIFSKGAYGVPLPHTAEPDTVDGSPLDLASNLLYLLRAALNTCIERVYPELTARYGITPDEWRVLAHLSRLRGANVDRLAATLELPIGPLTTQLGSLVAKGLLEWRSDEAVELTPSGCGVADRVVAFIQRDDQLCVAEIEEAGATHFKQGLRILAGQRAMARL